MEGRRGKRKEMKSTYPKLEPAWTRTSRPVNPFIPDLYCFNLDAIYSAGAYGRIKKHGRSSHPKALLGPPLLHQSAMFQCYKDSLASC